ncbi:MAG: right-handed parallel beta-helix repeat-containing protein, partial [Acidimicrobiia bacterium]|nr:right-handed parallel beta-helix repeat-containing protein [Acidimicrobiia bacterium]
AHEVSSNVIGGTSVFAADIDGDRSIDVASASSLDSKISWHEQGASAVPGAVLVPSEYPTIQMGIHAALPMDEVVVAPGLYYETVNFLGKPITVRSSDGPLVTTIDPFEENPFKCNDFEPCVQFRRSEGRDSVLSGFTLTEGLGFVQSGGCSLAGGGVYTEGASPTIEGCIFVANSAGGLIFEGGSPRIEGCYFEANEPGAVFSHGGQAEFSDCLFRQHDYTLQAGNGVTLTLDRCRILSSNSGLSGTSGATVVVTDCIFGSNFVGVDSRTFGSPSISISGTLFCNNEVADIDGDYIDAGGNWFLDACPPLEDVDVDGIVGFTDLLHVLTSWGLCVACPADIDFSNEVDFVDLVSVLAAWGVY